MSYYELWTILSNWRNEFTSEDFAKTFASPNPRKVLHDMTKKGLLKRSSYGKYKVKSVDDYVRSRNDISSGYDLLKKSDLSYALTDVDGVFVWTKGGYNAGRFFGSYPIHMKVLKSDVVRWKRFFVKHGKKTLLSEEKPRETLFGVYYVLYPEIKLKAATEGGLKVESLKDTVEFCKKNKYTFGPALELLDEEYNLGLKVRYR
ncbi:MAG: hypothetical protein QXW37_08620 [Candidatus Nitrosotenuis sp.]